MRLGDVPVWLAQASYDISATNRNRSFRDYQVDPDIDDARGFVLQSFWYSQSLARFGMAGGVPAATIDERLKTWQPPPPRITTGYMARYARQVASAAQGAMLMNVAKGMGILGGDSFVRKLGSGLGLDEATITTEGGFEESELLLGKRIGENLYVKYIIGLVDSLQKLALEYRLTERLSVEAETGLDSSVDLIYRIERD